MVGDALRHALSALRASQFGRRESAVKSLSWSLMARKRRMSPFSVIRGLEATIIDLTPAPRHF